MPLPTTAANETEMYARIQQTAMPGIRENSPAAVTATEAAAAGDNGNEIPTLFSAYENLQLPPSTTTSNGTDMYARIHQPALPRVQDNSPPAATAADAADATTAGVDNGDYEIPIPTVVAPSPPHT